MPFEMDSTISIHAPREGGDPAADPGLPIPCDFNPRPPRGGRPSCTADQLLTQTFQSTPPARGATHPIVVHRPPRQGISIHAPREGGDPVIPCLSADCWLFQSTPPARGATRRLCGAVPAAGISIHAPREGGDPTAATSRARAAYFNPRPPRGGRLIPSSLLMIPPIISIHAPREGGDPGPRQHRTEKCRISIHAPREGATRKVSALFDKLRYFNPRPPRGGRR